MNNYMAYIIKDKEYKPRYYKPRDGVIVTGDHICRFDGIMIVRSLCGGKSSVDIWSTRSTFKAEGSTKESMLQDPFKDLCQCLHFRDDWEEEDL